MSQLVQTFYYQINGKPSNTFSGLRSIWSFFNICFKKDLEYHLNIP